MPCCLACVAVAFPRVALVIGWLVGYTQPAFQTYLWPILGFLFLPYTTLAYAIALIEFGGISGFGLALLILGVIFDLSSHGGGGKVGGNVYRARYKKVD